MTLERLLAGSGIPSALLTGSTPAAGRRRTLGVLATGRAVARRRHPRADRADVEFARLAVASSTSSTASASASAGARREGAAGGEAAPHVLHMTATPIPRTLSLTAYGDLDTTTLRELPGRPPADQDLAVVGEEKREGAYEFIRDRLREGRQAFVVCPLVSELGEGRRRRRRGRGGRAARRAASSRDFTVAVLHGQMPSSEKAAAMERFATRRGRRAGRDERDRGRHRRRQRNRDADRGRRPLRPQPAPPAAGPDRPRRARVALHPLRRPGVASGPSCGCEAIVRERDGFELAEVDLALRGEGEVLGTRQSGLPRFRVAEPARGRRRAGRRPRRPARPGRRARIASSARRSARSLDAVRDPLRRRARRADRGLRARGARDRGRARRAQADGPPKSERSGRPPTASARRCSRSSATSRASSVLDLFCGTGCARNRGDLARRPARRPSSISTPGRPSQRRRPRHRRAARR